MGEVVVSSEGGGGMELLEVKETMEVEVAKEDDNKKTKRKGDDGSESGAATAAAAAASSAVRWNRFLPKMVVRVLLVEADDSTRQIISALLRKCSYRVAAVSDGLKAWEALKGKPHNVDLILTEVDLPSISGYALLTLIMEHDICKNIPVIMMSSHDSVSTVYKCMLRGAADFLVKPVRKNELRNLWQHVWRRQASSGGTLEPPDESVAEQKVEATAENNAISNHSSGYMASIQRNQERIEKGSDAQSSCTKPELPLEGADEDGVLGFARPTWRNSLPNGINIQNDEGHGNEKIQATASIDAHATAGEEDMDFKHQSAHVRDNYQASDNNDVLDSSREEIDLIGTFDNFLKSTQRISGPNTVMNKVDSLPLLDLSLRGSNPCASVNQVTDEKHKLNHSDASAFSRYVNRALQPQNSTSPSSCNKQQQQESNSDKQLSTRTLDYNSETHGPATSYQKHHSSTTGNSGSADIVLLHPQQRVISVPVPVRGMRFEGLSNSYGSVVPPIFCTQSELPPMQSPSLIGHQENSFQINPFQMSSNQTRNFHHFQNLMDQKANDAVDPLINKQWHKLELIEDRRYFSSATEQSGSSNLRSGAVGHLPNDGSNENPNTAPIVTSTAECRNEDGFLNHEGVSHRSTQREAALTKFRLKRKERCFEKKVRYESRKKLAEQRPRVKGQFVRQGQNEPPPGDTSTG